MFLARQNCYPIRLGSQGSCGSWHRWRCLKMRCATWRYRVPDPVGPAWVQALRHWNHRRPLRRYWCCTAVRSKAFSASLSSCRTSVSLVGLLGLPAMPHILLRSVCEAVVAPYHRCKDVTDLTRGCHVFSVQSTDEDNNAGAMAYLVAAG